MQFRKANKEDCKKILFFIKQLAIYEKMEKDVVATEEILCEWIFEKKKAEASGKIFDENNINPPTFVDFRMFSNAEWLNGGEIIK